MIVMLRIFRKIMEKTLDVIENEWLGQGKKFIVSDTLTIADIFVATEILQLSN